jgi:hypothetical protein
LLTDLTTGEEVELIEEGEIAALCVQDGFFESGYVAARCHLLQEAHEG